MSTQFFTPAAQKIFSIGSALKKNFVKQIHVIDKYTRLPIEKQFERLLRMVKGAPCILLDSDGTILSWNKEFEKLKGYKEAEILGQSFSIFYLPHERQEHLPEALLKLAIEKGTATHCGKRVRKDGTTFWGNITISPIRNSNMEVIGFTESTIVVPEQEND
jgi:PAS domain S-box-containing protein